MRRVNVETLTWTSKSGCGESSTHCVRVRCGAVGVAYGVCANEEDEMRVMLSMRCASHAGSGAPVLPELFSLAVANPKRARQLDN